MGNNLFGADIAGALAKALGKQLLPVILTKVTAGVRDPNNPTGPESKTETNHTCRGFIDTYDSRRMGGTAIEEGSPVVLILAATLPTGIELKPDDKVTINKVQHVVVGPVVSDPDIATYVGKLKK